MQMTLILAVCIMIFWMNPITQTFIKMEDKQVVLETLKIDALNKDERFMLLNYKYKSTT